MCEDRFSKLPSITTMVKLISLWIYVPSPVPASYELWSKLLVPKSTKYVCFSPAPQKIAAKNWWVFLVAAASYKYIQVLGNLCWTKKKLTKQNATNKKNEGAGVGQHHCSIVFQSCLQAKHTIINPFLAPFHYHASPTNKIHSKIPSIYHPWT